VVRVGRFVRVKGDAPEGTALYWGSAAIIDSRAADRRFSVATASGRTFDAREIVR